MGTVDGGEPATADPRFIFMDSPSHRRRTRAPYRLTLRFAGIPPAMLGSSFPEEMSEPGEITSLLRRLRSGDGSAADRLAEKAYPELHRVAEAHFRHERAGHLLQPTALVNEAWQKFVALDAVELSDRVHFLSLCSRLMRQVLVDYARRRATHERVVSSMRVDARGEENTLDLDLALSKLEEAQPRAARVVELRYFGGLSTEEIAQCLEVSLATVKRDWLTARVWLYRQLHGDPA